jgi:deoxyribonuclease (pyrimidine dimer)
MTRINTIAPSDLTNEWLLAEWRELPRIVNELEKHPKRFNLSKIPEDFTLNTGHVLFFRDKLLFLAKRHREIKKELKLRSIAHSKKVRVELHYLTPEIKNLACNDWQPTSKDHDILIERLQERFDLRKKAYSLTENGVKHTINCEHSFNEYLQNKLSKYY